MSSTLDLSTKRSPSPASKADSKRRSPTTLPHELLGSITSYVKGRSTVALARTSKEMNAFVSPELDSARLVDRAERAGRARDLAPLYADTPDDAPTPGHPQGQPNAIARLPAYQQAEPRAAVAAKLVDLARPLGGPNADSFQDFTVFLEIASLLRTLPDEEKLPVLAVLAAKSAFIGHDSGEAGAAHHSIAEMIENAPPASQPALWKALAGNVPELSQDDMPQAFTDMLEMMERTGPSPALRGDLLKLITPALSLFHPDELLDRSDSLIHAANDLPEDLRDGVQDQILKNLARCVVDMGRDRVPATLSYMLRLVEQRDPSPTRQEELLKNMFASSILAFESNDDRAEAADALIHAAEGLPGNHRDGIQAHIQATMAQGATLPGG
ncbi:hypothetical protein OVY01_01355 [Robbsia sp. Bb-Pol-6]|uniref:F-box domain-containing protein n=1 Tax=Robbsia betulipollinis TaxID=2981849 RepID=A0ABT3ZIV0_9BURK|nr:hypothetical protein [Robbsia betulipollinis]MCY0385908.1 hypothetical protein [Robbsia betulipollinis]